MSFITDNFLLFSPTAIHLYHEVAAPQPIIDYHTHLPPEEIAHDQRWDNITDLWLGHDHYKWRAMRANGIPESHITGDAPAREQFNAWAATIPHTVRNPLYHWTHLELKRCFGTDLLLSPDTADELWDICNSRLKDPDFSARGLLEKFNVESVGTTDHPTDTLDHHIANNAEFATKAYPTFRPDKALMVDRPHLLNPFIQELATLTGTPIDSVESLLNALKKRHDDFHAAGCRLSDHGLPHALADLATEKEAELIFQSAVAGNSASVTETKRFGALLMFHFAQWNHERDWATQLHLAPVRSPNSRMFDIVGPDGGFDTIGDEPQGAHLLKYFDQLDRIGKLPKTILYNLNPRDNAFFAAVCGSFQEAPTPGKIQWGAGWWFNDTKEGMENHIATLSSIGLLSRFIGMLTDSRSFLSYPRHEYFRRILCNIIGTEVDQGILPNDEKLLRDLIENLSYRNAKTYLNQP